MRVLLFVFLFLSLSSIIDRFVVDAQSSTPSAVTGRCPDGSDFVNCFASPCLNNQCKKGTEFCVEDYCGGCNAKCQCDTNTDCHDGESCQSGFCVAAAPATTAAPSNNCPSSVPTAECICLHKQKYWAVGGFHDGCTDCECKEDGRAICLAKVCPIIPTDEPTTDAPTSSVKPATTNTTQINTCVVTREEDFATCQGGITPCSTVRCGTGPCIAHRCGTNGQCAALCSCESDSNCFDGGRCVANEFGIKVCKEAPTNSTPINTCVLRNDFSSCENQMNPCAVTLCAAGTVCVPHKCENNQCSAVCACGSDSDCGAGSVCVANDFGIKVCKEKPVTVNPSTPAPSTTACAGRVCPAILCANRAPCKHRCEINYCGCTDYCVCRNNTDCEEGEQCEGASFGGEGKCTAAPTTPAPATCSYNGCTYQVGASFPSNDGCNTCFCGENGSVGCTKKACICPPEIGFSTCKQAPCDANKNVCRSGATCINNYCGGCNTKCQCESNDQCYNDEVCRADDGGFSYCVKRTTTTPRPTRTTTIRPTRTTTTTKRATTTTRRPTTTTRTTRTTTTTTAPSNSTCILRRDFSSCENQMNPCAVTLCAAGTVCVPHKCENNQCAAVCSCSNDSDCSTGLICAANDFGIKVCTEDPSKTCPDGRPEVRCAASPCSVASRQCKKGRDFCVDDYCGGCNAKCSCETNADCYSGEVCQADWKGKNFCAPAPSTPAPSTTPCNPSGRVCPAILCTKRECKRRCAINYCGCTDYCTCKRNSDCLDGERCVGATFFKEGKCTLPSN